MDELSVAVPRQLRVQRTMTWGAARMPLRTIIVLAIAVVLLALVTVLGGAFIPSSVVILGSALITVIILEGRWLGWSTTHFARMVWQYVTRARYTRLAPRTVVITQDVIGRRVNRPVRWNMPVPAKGHMDAR